MELFSQGAVIFYLLLGGALALALGLVLLALYRRAVTAAMRGASAPPLPGAIPPGAPGADRRPQRLPELRIEALAVESGARLRAPRSATFRAARRVMRRTSLVYAAAGLAHAAVSVTLLFWISKIEFLPLRTAVSFWALAWPVVLTFVLLWGPDRRRLPPVLVGYFGALLALGLGLSLFTDTPALPVAGVAIPAFAQPLLQWALMAAPTVFLLLFLNRRIRAVGPLLLVFLLIALAGAFAAVLAMATDPGLRLVASLSAKLSIDVGVLFWGFQFLGFFVFSLPALAIVLLIRDHYLDKRISDQTLILDGVWLFATLALCSSLASSGAGWGWLGLSAFAAFWVVRVLGMRWAARSTAAGRAPARLLLLRVFGYRRRSERLFDLLSARWRYAGPIQAIAAADLAASSVDPDEFLDFLGGRLRRRFLRGAADIDARLGGLDWRPDPDGRFRVNELFCAGEAWRETVRRLFDLSDLIVMDLRGFSAANQGCVFELGALIDRAPIGRIVFLVDQTTDATFLRSVLAERWAAMPATSPNASPGAGAISLLSAGNDAAAVRRLMALGDGALAG